MACHLGFEVVTVQEHWVDWPDALYDKVGNIQLSRIMGADVRLDPSGFDIGIRSSCEGAIADVEAGKAGAVPAHLRDAHYAGAKKMGSGKGYRYPHDDPDGVLAQQYPPDDLVGVDYYTPTDHGFERELGPRLAKLRSIVRRVSRR